MSKAAPSDAMIAAASRMAAQAMFYNMVLDQFRGASPPSSHFLEQCFAENMSAGEAARLWSNRFAR
jgi:hypothetical protein